MATVTQVRGWYLGKRGSVMGYASCTVVPFKAFVNRRSL